MPTPSDTLRPGLSLNVSLAEPVVYAAIGISTADDKTHTADNPKWNTSTWGNKYGNEGIIGAPATIFRVHRQRPPSPVPPRDAVRVYASIPDYHSHSFYTYRWISASNLKVHIFRALDDALFNTDWLQRPRGSLAPTELQLFPDETNDPRWDLQKRQQVAAELNVLNTFARDAAGTAQAMIYYRNLSNDALRVLAGLPGNERAFTQITIQPLDPAERDSSDPSKLRWRDRVGPDTDTSYVPNAALRAYVDTLDGRSTNRYFYRSAYVDEAHNLSQLSLSSPPIWLPDLAPPNKPRLLKTLGDNRSIHLHWNVDRNLVNGRCLIYRTGEYIKSRDIRLMGTPVASLPANPLVLNSGQVDLGAGTDVVMVEKVYNETGFDPKADLLTGQTAVQYLPAPTPSIGTSSDRT